MTIKCIVCGDTFIFEKGEQDFYRRKELNFPSRCSDCRKTKDFNKEKSGEDCKDFAAGKCRYGANCRHSHGRAPDAKGPDLPAQNSQNCLKISQSDVDAESQNLQTVFTCKEPTCQKNFTVDGPTQEWYKSKNLHLPVRCEDCRKRRKEAAEAEHQSNTLIMDYLEHDLPNPSIIIPEATDGRPGIL